MIRWSPNAIHVNNLRMIKVKIKFLLQVKLWNERFNSIEDLGEDAQYHETLSIQKRQVAEGNYLLFIIIIL